MTLEEAVHGGDLAAARSALQDGADVNRRNAQGLAPLMIASGLGQPAMVALLLSEGADSHAIEPQMGATALHKAAQSGSAEVIGMLLDHGAFIDQQSPVLGNTPLIDAVLYKRDAAVRLFLARGARTTIRNHWQQSALELARDDGSELIVRSIEARDAADAEEADSRSLIAAVKAGDVATVERLIAAGADIDERTPVLGRIDDDYTALGIAVRERRSEIVGLLLEAGGNAGGTTGLMRGTSVHEAAFVGFADILQALLARHRQIGDLPAVLGATGPYNGLTALHDAVWQGHLEAATTLVAFGASLSARSHTGLTPCELARAYGHDDLAAMLAEAEEASSP